MKERDYIIVKSASGTGKPYLARVNSIGSDTIEILVEKNVHRDRSVLEITKKDVMLRLGPEPTPGTVYGCDVANIYRKSFVHEFWGTIYFFVKPEPSVLKVFRNSLDRTADRIRQLGLEAFTDCFTTEVRAKKGKWAGMYNHGGGDKPNTIWYAIDWAGQDPVAMDYVIYHEFGHVLRFNGLTSKKAQARWLKVFHKSIQPNLIEHKQLKAIWRDLKAVHSSQDEITFHQALKELGAEDEEVAHRIKILGRWFKQIHHLGMKDLATIWAAGDLDQLESLWPTVAIDSSKLNPLVSEYATKNVEELWAESFAMFCQKKKLPDQIETLMDKSLSLVKANKPA